MFEVRSSARHGRGLFATEPIPRDTLLMHAPVLLIAAVQREALQATIVDDYVYEWDDDGTAALVLGVSSMCNHAEDPNAYLWLVPEGPSAELVALVDIAPGEEITVSYRAEAGPETGPLWFTVRDG
ncbi:MAG: SET domain-containing protein-lysine N-methyltransferase [Nitriliruptoraceae bacterium]